MADSLDISRDTVKFELRRLVRLGKLKKIGAGCNTKYLRTELVPAYNDLMKGVSEIERAQRTINNSMYRQTSSEVCKQMKDTKLATARGALSVLYRRNKIDRKLTHRNGAAKYSKLELASTYRPIGCKRIPTIALMERVVVSSDVPLTKREIVAALKDERIIGCHTAHSALLRLVEAGKIRKEETERGNVYSKP